MAKQTSRPKFSCSECGWETVKWVGRCGECQAWGSVAEVAAPKGRTHAAPTTTSALPIGEVDLEESAAHTSGVPELDRVLSGGLGGGLVKGAAILLAGEPGVGKSTLLLEVAAQTARYQRRVLYVTGEESASQVRRRAERTGGIQDELYLAAETDLGAVLTHIEQVRPELIVVDSVQTIGASGIDGVPGGVTQVKEVAAALIRVAKTRNITTVLVGHVTKDGGIAGPRVLEHLVDVVLHFEGDRESRFRLVRAMKNRFGPVDEVGCFEMTSEGITAVLDPTGLFMETHHHPAPGTCVSVTLEGRRPLPAELQSLVTPTLQERPRRTTSGLDGNRLAMILAVLQRHCGIPVHMRDIFVSTVGGARITDPAADLALALAVASAELSVPNRPGMVAMGEIGLAGELRRVRDLETRLAEAARLGFGVALVPAEAGQPGGRERVVEGMRVFELASVAEALALTRLTKAQASPEEEEAS